MIAPPKRQTEEEIPVKHPSGGRLTPVRQEDTLVEVADKVTANNGTARPVPDENRHKLPGLKVVGNIELHKDKPPAPPVSKVPTLPEAEPEKAPPVVVETPPEKPVNKPELPVIAPVVTAAPVEEKKPEPVAEPVAEKQPEVVTKPQPKPEPVEATPEPATVALVQPEVIKEEEKKVTAPEPEIIRAAPELLAVPVAAEKLVRNELVTAKAETLKGLTVLGKIELPSERDRLKKKNPAAGTGTPANSNAASAAEDKKKAKRKRKRMRVSEGGAPNANQPAANTNNTTAGTNTNTNNPNRATISKVGQKPAGAGTGDRGKTPIGKRPFEQRTEVTDREIQDKIKATLAKLSGNRPTGGGRGQQRRGLKRTNAREEMARQEQEQSKVLKVTEFISASDLSSLMNVSINEVISVCLNLGMFVSINQRLDAEAITVIADEFGYDAQFISAEEEINVDLNVVDSNEDLQFRAPIVTIMGHVDHGKTSLLDYIRKSRVTAGEAGGITQHIGAYDVTTDTDKRIAFLDTPGHEAFTAMRARGAKITDVVIIVVAADDNVMPQTKEAINHAQAAGVPIVIAINKVDKPNANPEKIREELAKENILVEDWGGKYQCQEISAKTGQGVADLLEKVLLEAELLDLKANPDKRASGTVIEASLDKGRGYVTTIMVQTGTLKVGDIILAGAHYGRVKAMMDHRGTRLKKAGPSTPVQVLGLGGAPQAGDKFNVMESEREAREIATKREQIVREQSIRTKKHITLDEIGRRLALDSFKELNIIVKGDVDGSVEALSDSLLRLSTAEVQVRIIQKGVGQISESDVLLASASDAIIVGFQVRPSVNARKLAEQEEIEIRMYSIIYDAINEVKDAMEGMLAPKIEEVILGTIEVRDVFKISKIGTVAGCYVTDGVIKRNAQIRLVRDGIVVHTGAIDALKRFKDDVNEVKFGYECGLSIKGFNDIQVADTIECFETRETKRTL